MHNVEIPLQFKFLEHIQTQFDHDNPLFSMIIFCSKLNVSTNISFIDPVQYEIYDLNAQYVNDRRDKA
jgi:hypothetical protein